MGGMAAFIPSRATRRSTRLRSPRCERTRTARHAAGFDGSWVAHPDLVPVCAEIFDGVLDGDNQVDRQRDDVRVTAADLLAAVDDARRADSRRAAAQHQRRHRLLAAWLDGNGAAAIHNLMEDAATAEISRSQIWQWTHNAAALTSGEAVTKELVESLVTDEYAALEQAGWYVAHLPTARRLFLQTALDDEFVDFLTLPAYAAVLEAESED